MRRRCISPISFQIGTDGSRSVGSTTRGERRARLPSGLRRLRFDDRRDDPFQQKSRRAAVTRFCESLRCFARRSAAKRRVIFEAGHAHAKSTLTARMPSAYLRPTKVLIALVCGSKRTIRYGCLSPEVYRTGSSCREKKIPRSSERSRIRSIGSRLQPMRKLQLQFPNSRIRAIDKNRRVADIL